MVHQIGANCKGLIPQWTTNINFLYKLLLGFAEFILYPDFYPLILNSKTSSFLKSSEISKQFLKRSDKLNTQKYQYLIEQAKKKHYQLLVLNEYN